ncbi:MAG: hypothetical protein AMXMBFR45_02900 [Gammaproteobacteria bacterium]|nr:hypothetical protein [Bryobacterales bacterium]
MRQFSHAVVAKNNSGTIFPQFSPLIVSGDDDLLALDRFGNIPILAAREALDLIATATR